MQYFFQKAWRTIHETDLTYKFIERSCVNLGFKGGTIIINEKLRNIKLSHQPKLAWDEESCTINQIFKNVNENCFYKHYLKRSYLEDLYLFVHIFSNIIINNYQFS